MTKTIVLCLSLIFSFSGHLWGQSNFPSIDLLEDQKCWEFRNGSIETDTTSENDEDVVRGEPWKMKHFLNSITASKEDPWGIYDHTHFAFGQDKDGRYLRIGNYQVGSQADVAIGSFLVPQEGHYLVFLEAQVFVEDPGHSRKEQPSFYVGIERNDRSDPCSKFSNFADRAVFNSLGGCDRFISHSGVPLYRSKWIPVILDLGGFAGQKLSITLRINDCRQGAHFAAMFVRVKLMPATLTVDWCNGGEAIVTAPPGFQYYKWSDGQTGQSIAVKNPKSGQKISCNSISVSKCPVVFQTLLQEKRPFPFTVDLSTPSCNGGTGTLSILPAHPAQIFVNEVFAGSTHAQESFELKSLAGTYRIKIQNDSTCSEQSLVLKEPSALTSALTISDYNGVAISCKGDKDGFIHSQNAGGAGNYTSVLLQINGDTIGVVDGEKADFQNLRGGLYNIVLSDTNGCQIKLSAQLAEPDSFIVEALSKDALCHRLPGSVEFSFSGGTGGIASYDIWRWRDQKPVSPDSLFAGKYEATVYDMNGCQAESAFQIKQPKPLTASSQAYKLLGIHFFIIKADGGNGRYRYSIGKHRNQRPLLIHRLVIATKAGMSAQINIEDKNDCPCMEKVRVPKRLIRLPWDTTPIIEEIKTIVCPPPNS